MRPLRLGHLLCQPGATNFQDQFYAARIVRSDEAVLKCSPAYSPPERATLI